MDAANQATVLDAAAEIAQTKKVAKSKISKKEAQCISKYGYVKTDDFLTISHKSEAVTVLSSDSRYAKAVKALTKSMYSQEQLKEAMTYLQAPVGISESELLSKYNIKVDRKTNSIELVNLKGSHESWVISNLCSTNLIKAMNDNDEEKLKGLVNFTVKLSENPSYKVVEELYNFIIKGDIEINSEGDLITYKKIRSDFTDVHSGKIRQEFGKPIYTQRNRVDDESSRTCSVGYHVCSKGYLQHFSGDVVISCAVSPADVVSIPKDYNDTKMRVCRYTPIAQV